VEDPDQNIVQAGLSEAAVRAAIAEYQNGIDEDEGEDDA